MAQQGEGRRITLKRSRNTGTIVAGDDNEVAAPEARQGDDGWFRLSVVAGVVAALAALAGVLVAVL